MPPPSRVHTMPSLPVHHPVDVLPTGPPAGIAVHVFEPKSYVAPVESGAAEQSVPPQTQSLPAPHHAAGRVRVTPSGSMYVQALVAGSYVAPSPSRHVLPSMLMVPRPMNDAES